METLLPRPPMVQEEFYYRNLVADALWNRLVERIQKENPLLPGSRAALIIDGTLGFLKLCADFPEHRFAPSKMVDVGWHTFLMYTREYRAFCHRVSGRFIHHEPNDKPGHRAVPVSATVGFMDRTGVPYHESLWIINSEDCDSGPPDCGEGDCNADGDADSDCSGDTGDGGDDG